MTPVTVHSPGVDKTTLQRFRRVAGDADMDERCRRILGAYRESWFGIPYDSGQRRAA